jgi:hypothetical protein
VSDGFTIDTQGLDNWWTLELAGHDKVFRLQPTDILPCRLATVRCTCTDFRYADRRDQIAFEDCMLPIDRGHLVSELCILWFTRRVDYTALKQSDELNTSRFMGMWV